MNVDAMTTAEVYAAWGTTEDAHLEKMFAIIDRENAKVSAGGTRRQARKGRFAGVRVAASPGYAAARPMANRFAMSKYLSKGKSGRSLADMKKLIARLGMEGMKPENLGLVTIKTDDGRIALVKGSEIKKGKLKGLKIKKKR